MDLRTALSRLLSLLPGKGRPQSPPPAERKMRRGYQDKMRHTGADK